MSLYPICLTRSKKEVQKAANKKRVYLVLRIAIWETLLLLLLVASVVCSSDLVLREVQVQDFAPQG